MPHLLALVAFDGSASDQILRRKLELGGASIWNQRRSKMDNEMIPRIENIMDQLHDIRGHL